MVRSLQLFRTFSVFPTIATLAMLATAAPAVDVDVNVDVCGWNGLHGRLWSIVEEGRHVNGNVLSLSP